MTSLVRVAVEAPLRSALTYRLPKEEAFDENMVGRSVLVPLAKRTAPGVILGPAAEDTGEFQIKEISTFDEERVQIPKKLLSWLERLANYYAYPVGQVVQLAYPPLKKVGRKKTTEILTTSKSSGVAPIRLTDDQSRTISAIESKSGFQTHLIFGVTGSGKTEVYLKLLERVLARGGRGLVLVPEISLTPQLLARFNSRFGDKIAVLHSHLTDRERTNQWWEIVEGRKEILIGARSALFCPIPNLQLIVVDEEHEPSFKQDEKFRYHARDAAIMLAQTLDIPIVLGSATPSLESWQNALSEKFQLHRMSGRASDVEMPEVTVVSLKTKDSDESENPLWATPELIQKMQTCLENGEQAALFLNRRGQAQAVLCPGCGARRECPNCSIGLTLHSRSSLVCHYCDYHETMPEVCNVCRESELKAIGIGTEKVESEVHELLPSARVIRADRDEIQSRQELEEFITKVENHEVDVLVGTQMIAKGLDFQRLTLVGVLLADIALSLPDFRAAERSFQLLAQVSGRAGRHKKRGEVLIQTFNPEHPSIIHAKNHDFESFAAQELVNREELGYPPFGRLALLRLQGLDKKRVENAADRVAAKVQAWINSTEFANSAEVLGPAEAPIFRLRNNFRYQILIKGPKNFSLSAMASKLLDQQQDLGPGVRLLVDIDPINMM